MARPLSNNKHLILEVLNQYGELTPSQIGKRLSSIPHDKIQRGVYHLVALKAVEKTDRVIHSNDTGRPEFLYRALKTKLDRSPSIARVQPPLPVKTLYSGAQGRVGYRFRDEKVNLLQRLLPHTHDRDRDLLIGILSDYGLKTK